MQWVKVRSPGSHDANKHGWREMFGCLHAHVSCRVSLSVENVQHATGSHEVLPNPKLGGCPIDTVRVRV